MLCPLRINAAMLIGTVVLAGMTGEAFPRSAETYLLQLETKIPLGNVRGRIDHMAVDVKRQRIFVAELGNDAIGIVDLAQRRLIRTIAGQESISLAAASCSTRRADLSKGLPSVP